MAAWPGWLVEDPAFAGWLRRRAPGLFRRHDRRALRWVAGGLAATLAVGLFLWFGLPLAARSVAAWLPEPWLEGLGDQMTMQLIHRWPACYTRDSFDALYSLEQQIVKGRPVGRPLTVTVLDSPQINALTLPGGRVLMLRGLIDAASTPEEVAGVLAHEFGHVAHRHAERLLVEVGGGALLLDAFFSGSGSFETAATVGTVLLVFSYGRDMEREADTYAREALRASGIGEADLHRFFVEMSARTDEPPAFLSTHPSLAERAAATDPDSLPAREILSPKAFRALKRVCD